LVIDHKRLWYISILKQMCTFEPVCLQNQNVASDMQR